jgi:predicted DNA-binding protein YlxM (UPF0122 family)
MATNTVLPAPRKLNRVDVAKALKLRLQGATLEDIADLQGVTKQAIDQALTKFQPFMRGLEPGQLTAYSEERANLFNVVEQHLTESLLDPDAMAKASLNNRAYAFKQIHEARRLEAGQSTSNISVLGKFIQQAEAGLGATAASKPLTKAEPEAEDGNRVNP